MLIRCIQWLCSIVFRSVPESIDFHFKIISVFIAVLPEGHGCSVLYFSFGPCVQRFLHIVSLVKTQPLQETIFTLNIQSCYKLKCFFCILCFYYIILTAFCTPVRVSSTNYWYHSHIFASIWCNRLIVGFKIFCRSLDSVCIYTFRRCLLSVGWHLLRFFSTKVVDEQIFIWLLKD